MLASSGVVVGSGGRGGERRGSLRTLRKGASLERRDMRSREHLHGVVIVLIACEADLETTNL